MKRVQLGAGEKPKAGFINCDCRKLPGIDKVFDLEKFPWPFDGGTVGYILTCETLEHLSWRSQEKVFAEMFRILDRKGHIHIQVPDIGAMCKNYVFNEVCDCVPHKSETDTFEAAPDCPKCEGVGKVNPTRWLMAFCGAQKHPADTHRTVFTKEYLEDLATKAGFVVLSYEDHPYKIKVLLEKP